MRNLLSLITLITFAWTTLAQALPSLELENIHRQSNTSISTSAVISLVNNEGDPRKAAKAFASRDTFQSLGMSMLSAGLTYSALDTFGLATDATKVVDFADHVANQGVNMGVRVAIDLGVHGKTDGISAGLGAVAGTIGGYMGCFEKSSESARFRDLLLNKHIKKIFNFIFNVV